MVAENILDSISKTWMPITTSVTLTVQVLFVFVVISDPVFQAVDDGLRIPKCKCKQYAHALPFTL